VQLDALNESTLIALGSAAMVLVMAGVCVILIRRCRRLGRYARRARRHRAAIARLRRSTELSAADRYWGQIRSATAPVLVTSPEGAILAASGAATELFGYQTEEQLRAISVADLYFNPTDRLKSLSTPLLEQGHIRSSEFRMKRCDGRPVNVLTSVRLVMSEGATFYEGVLTDITELRAAFDERQHLESQLHLAKKLELVGRLASGIAHEINTPMQFVSDSVHFMKTAAEELNPLWSELKGLLNGEDPKDIAARIQELAVNTGIDELMLEVTQSADRALKGVRRVTKIIRAMREFAHPDSGEHTAVDINHAIETTLTVCRNVYKEVAEVETQFGNLPSVMCQYGEVNQVFLNMIVNAVHAIEARRHSDVRGLIRIATRSENQWVVISIADNGAGIPDSVKSRIFDPFFTTKEVGKGTGQGLAIAQSVIVTRHKGRISVESEVGKGTTFEIRLPLNSSTTQSSGVEHEAET
jgi:PAS domain S-box-containing protein